MNVTQKNLAPAKKSRISARSSRKELNTTSPQHVAITQYMERIERKMEQLLAIIGKKEVSHG